MQQTSKERWVMNVKSTIHFLFTFGAAVCLVLVPGTSTFDLIIRLLGLLTAAFAPSCSAVVPEEQCVLAITAAFLGEVIFAMTPYMLNPKSEVTSLYQKLPLAIAADVLAFSLVLAWASRNGDTLLKQRIGTFLGYVSGFTAITALIFPVQGDHIASCADKVEGPGGLHKQSLV
ncbi:hypothetical protein MIND_00547900 [Mycena indigotica]|uniref:Uncharacterized protein n=1 Tax=Mycena indigotica TaxID=2126181 RepID=A0A8H6W911_9AGAR|nr:uncharacterized protein MIND_00547900 [Mycena indigotica]KAF7307531.1 hypothetical protein MIND_00547900 [Mycena indigotica]